MTYKDLEKVVMDFHRRNYSRGEMEDQFRESGHYNRGVQRVINEFFQTIEVRRERRKEFFFKRSMTRVVRGKDNRIYVIRKGRFVNKAIKVRYQRWINILKR